MKERHDVLEWCAKAENDFMAACNLAEREDGHLQDIVCYHCQQSCEKYLKAFIISKDGSPPWVHDLDNLLDICVIEDPDFKSIREQIGPLTPYASEYRYPGESATVDEAKDALKKMKEVRGFVRNKLLLDDRNA